VIDHATTRDVLVEEAYIASLRRDAGWLRLAPRQEVEAPDRHAARRRTRSQREIRLKTGRTFGSAGTFGD
jgi:hypothetical protein